MRTFNLDTKRCPAELKLGLKAISAVRKEKFSRKPDAVRLGFEKDESLMPRGLAVTSDDAGAVVRYARKIDAFRALGRILGQEGEGRPQGFSETPLLETAGVMIDVSRNAVLKLDGARDLLARCALMGLNMAMLYTEDTYEIPGEPFFGYMRGRYSASDLKDLDDFADSLGIEMIPCIQTLGHLEQILQWPAYRHLRDTNSVLMVGDEGTYELVSKMIRAASAPFRTKRIHIGMDEAWGIGTGEYRNRNGEQRPFDIINQHLARVRAICEEQGLKPMIWSDMYFRIGSKTGDYYDKECVIPPDVAAGIPKDVQLVYWDYYHKSKEFYLDWIQRHRALGSEPIMAGGIWTWSQLWTQLPFTFTVANACMAAVKETLLREAFITLWGDDGNEYDIYSALPALQLFAEHAHADQVVPDILRANFRGSCGAEMDDWLKASELDAVPGLEESSGECSNVSKWLLWQDTVLGLMDPEIEGFDLAAHYRRLSETLDIASEKRGMAKRLKFPALLARVLSIKCNLRSKLAAAYTQRDRNLLRNITKTDLNELRKSVDALWRCHRGMWLSTYRPFGWEVIEQRYGGLRARLESLEDRLRQYLRGRVKSIPEFEVQPLKISSSEGRKLPRFHSQRTRTASVIK